MFYYLCRIIIFMSLKLASGSYDGTVKFWDPSNGANNPNEEIKLNKYNLIPNRI